VGSSATKPESCSLVRCNNGGAEPLMVTVKAVSDGLAFPDMSDSAPGTYERAGGRLDVHLVPRPGLHKLMGTIRYPKAA
jgi:hypothetical protein